MAARLNPSRRLRATPYTTRVEALGVTDFSVTNHTILPKGFECHSVDEQYLHLREHVQLWDVGCQRQVQLRGPDAAKLTQLMTPRDLSGASVGQCLYAPMIDASARMLNDPIILKLADDHFWLSIADSDVLLWAKGLAAGMALDVEIDEPDVWPMAIQGPQSDDLAARVFGDAVRDIRFFRYAKLPFESRNVIVARTGYSTAGGFEIYPEDTALAQQIWDAIWAAGDDLQLKPGCPNLIDRIEGGLLSYGNEMTRDENPIESGLEKYCQLDSSIDYIGRDALLEIAERGVDRQIRGVLFGTDRCPPCGSAWPVTRGDTQIGYITSAIWSPGFKRNVGLAMIDREHWAPGKQISVVADTGDRYDGEVTALPFPSPGAR